MTVFTFTGANLARVAAYAAEKKVPILIVKDEGIYILPQGGGDPDPTKRVVCYAKGYDPALCSDPGMLFDRCREAAGGDDFAEKIPASDEMLEFAQKDGALFRVTVSASRISASCSLPPGAKVARTLTLDQAAKELARMMRKQLVVAMPDGRVPVWNMRKGDANNERTFALWRKGCAAKYPGGILLNELPIGDAARLYAEAMAKAVPVAPPPGATKH